MALIPGQPENEPAGVDATSNQSENPWRFGGAAVALGLPVAIHPEVAKGEYSAAVWEDESCWAQQSEWHAPGQSFVSIWCAIYSNPVLRSHPTDPAAVADDHLTDDGVEGIEDQGHGALWIWGGTTKWAYKTATRTAQGDKIHVLAFDWLSEEKRRTWRGLMTYVTPPHCPLVKPVTWLKALVIDGVGGMA